MTAVVTGKRWDQYLVDLGDGRGMIYDADEEIWYPQQNSATTAIPPSSPTRMAIPKRDWASLPRNRHGAHRSRASEEAWRKVASPDRRKGTSERVSYRSMSGVNRRSGASAAVSRSCRSSSVSRS